MPLPFFNNPFLFAAVAVVAIGVVVYEIISRQEEKRVGNRGRKQPASSPPSTPIYRPTSPPSKSSDSSDCNNTVRKRKIDQSASKPNSSEVIKRKIDTVTPGDVKENLVGSKDEQGTGNNLPSNASNQNVDDKKFDEKNYEKNVLDKITNDTKDVGMKVKRKESLVKNISEEDSDSSENNEKKLNNTDISNQRDQSCSNSHNKEQNNQSFRSQSAVNSDTECSDTSSSLDSMEELYKTKVHNALKNDVKNKNKLCLKNREKPSGSSSGCSVGAVRSEKSENTLFYTESSTCRGCEENPVNARAHPCNHRYLCIDCAVKIFRLHKKCSICHYDIGEFVVFDP